MLKSTSRPRRTHPALPTFSFACSWFELHSLLSTLVAPDRLVGVSDSALAEAGSAVGLGLPAAVPAAHQFPRFPSCQHGIHGPMLEKDIPCGSPESIQCLHCQSAKATAWRSKHSLGQKWLRLKIYSHGGAFVGGQAVPPGRAYSSSVAYP